MQHKNLLITKSNKSHKIIYKNKNYNILLFPIINIIPINLEKIIHKIKQINKLYACIFISKNATVVGNCIPWSF